PRSAWKKPAMRTAEETKSAYKVFADYVRFMKRFPDVQFITASEAAKLYADKARGKRFGAAELKAVAKGVGDGVAVQTHKGYALTASEVFFILNSVVAGHASEGKPEPVVLADTPLGPTGKVPALTEAVTTDDSQFRRTSRDVADYLKKHGRVPSSVWLG